MQASIGGIDIQQPHY